MRKKNQIKKEIKPKTSFKAKLKRFIIFTMIVISVFVLAMSLGIGILLSYIKSLPPIEQLENYNPPQMSEVYDNTGQKVLARFSLENREVVAFKDIPKNLIYAFVSIEDARFFEHFGIDIKRIFSAIIIDIKRRQLAQGASTITQQLPRNLLSDVTKKKTISRKLKEILLALKIESSYSKEQIIEFYLNQIWLGKGSYGVKAAARSYFNKDLKDLTLAECASIAAITQRPGLYSPTKNPQKNKSRRDIVLASMYKNGYISENDYEKAIKEPIATKPPAAFYDNAPYFVDYLQREFSKDATFGSEDLKTQGYRIYSTLDFNIQQICREELSKGLVNAEEMWQGAKPERFYAEDADPELAVLKKGQTRLAKILKVKEGALEVQLKDFTTEIKLPETLPYYQPDKVIKEGGLIDVLVKDYSPSSRNIELELFDKSRVQGAIVVLDTHTGEILTLIGGEDFFDKDNSGMWNRAALAQRQPGSCFKPFFYAVAFDKGYNLSTVFVDSQITFSDGYSPKNYENKFFGPTTLQEALEHSRNVVTVKLFLSLGIKRSLNLVKKFDMPEIEGNWNMPPYPTICLGNVAVTPLEITAAYIPFVNQGIEIQPYSIKRITDKSGKSLKSFKAKERVVISSQAAYQTTYALMGVIERGTGYENIGTFFEKKKDIPQMAGKTGTTNDCNDAWFIGYTPDIVMSVFVGFDQNKTLGPKMTGGKVAGPIWRNIMDRILQSKSPEAWKKKFDIPKGMVVRDICSATGMLAKESCKSSGALVYYSMPFKQGTEPTAECARH